MIPGTDIEFYKDSKETFAREVSAEIERVARERVPMEELWRKWQSAYEANALPEKTFPWKHCSNINVPLVPINTNAIASRIVGTIWDQKPIYTPKTWHKNYFDTRKPLRNFLEWAIRNEIDFYGPFRNWVSSTVLMGTGIIKLLWWREERKVYSPTKGGKTTLEPIYNAPRPFLLDLENFYISDPTSTIDEAHWVAERIWMREGTLKKRVLDERFDEEAVKEILANPTGRPEIDKDKDKAEGVEREGFQDYELYETYVRLDVDNDGYEEDCVITIHLPTSKIVRAVYNERHSGVRPFVAARLEERPNRFYAIGVGARVYDLKEHVNTVLNQRIDNATLANTIALLVRKGASLGSGPALYPGVMLPVEDINNDVKKLEFGDVYRSSIDNEKIIRDYIERVTGVSDYTLGRESSIMGGRATATGTMALIQEGNKRLDLNIRDFRESLSELGMQIMELYQQYCPKGRTYYVLGDEEGEAVRQVFKTPRTRLRSHFKFDITATTMAINKEVQKQSNMALFEMMLNFYDRLAQGAKVLLDPNVPQPLRDVIAKTMSASNVLAERIFDSFDIQDVESLLPSVEEIVDQAKRRGEGGAERIPPLPVGEESPPLSPGVEGGLGEPPSEL